MAPFSSCSLLYFAMRSARSRIFTVAALHFIPGLLQFSLCPIRGERLAVKCKGQIIIGTRNHDHPGRLACRLFALYGLVRLDISVVWIGGPIRLYGGGGSFNDFLKIRCVTIMKGKG